MAKMFSQWIYQYEGICTPYSPFLLSPWESSPLCGLFLLLDGGSYPHAPAQEFHFCNCPPSILFSMNTLIPLTKVRSPIKKKNPHDFTSLSNYNPFLSSHLWQNHLKELSVLHFWSFQVFLEAPLEHLSPLFHKIASVLVIGYCLAAPSPPFYLLLSQQ